MELKLRKKDDLPKVIELLRAVPIFHDMQDKDLESLLEVANEATFPPGHVIVQDGSFLADFYIILQGKVEVRKKETPLAHLKTGDFFGEMAFLNDKPTGRSADIVAIEQTRCLFIKGAHVYSFLRKNPDVAIEIMRVLANRLREMNWALSSLQNMPPASGASK
jgi:CRP/FNR family transcriptional regulator, cyclic AMP receptor protein